MAAKSTQVNSKLQERHDQMEDLTRVRALLIKLQAVFHLPKQLRAAIDQGAVEIAVDKYADVAGLLKVYGHKVRRQQIIPCRQSCPNDVNSCAALGWEQGLSRLNQAKRLPAEQPQRVLIIFKCCVSKSQRVFSPTLQGFKTDFGLSGSLQESQHRGPRLCKRAHIIAAAQTKSIRLRHC